MTLEDIDAVLADWEGKLSSARDNLLALTQMVTYKRLLGEDGWPRAVLTGLTAGKVGPAVENVQALWAYLGLFKDHVRRTAEVRRSVNWLLPSPRALQELEDLVRGEAIALPAEERPLAERGLLSVAVVVPRCSAARLLDTMTTLFIDTKAVVLAVDDVWQNLPVRLAAHADELAVLERLVPPGDAPAALRDARDRIKTLSGLAEHDPLTAAEEVKELARLITPARAALDGLRAEYERFRLDLTAARETLLRLHAIHRQARDSAAERALKVALDDEPAVPRPADDQLVAAMGPWLTKLEQTAAGGLWKPARVGLGRWDAAARQYTAQDERSLAHSTQTLRTRLELRGLLDALRAKARNHGLAEDTEVAAIGDEARRLLHSRPTPLRRAEQLLNEYESRLL